MLIYRIFPKKRAESYRCAGCGREKFGDQPFCHVCERLMTPLSEENLHICPKCGRRTSGEGLCLDCKETLPAFDACRALFDYLPPATGMIFRIKFRNHPMTCKILAPAFKDVWEKSGFSADAVCFIPMMRKAERKRGYNQAKLLAMAFSEITGIPMMENALEKVKNNRVQHELNKSERAQNLQGCYKAASTEILRGKRLVLFDDVITTGATLSHAAELLKKKGVSAVYCLAVCATPDPMIRQILLKERETSRKK